MRSPRVSPTYWRKAVWFLQLTPLILLQERKVLSLPNSHRSGTWISCLLFTPSTFFQCAGSHLPQSINAVKVWFAKYAFTTAHKKWEGDSFVLECNKISIFFLKNCKSNLISSQLSLLKIKSLPLSWEIQDHKTLVHFKQKIVFPIRTGKLLTRHTSLCLLWYSQTYIQHTFEEQVTR